MKHISLNDNWYVYPKDDAFALVEAVPDDAVHTSVPYDALWHEGQRSDSVNGGRTSYFDGQVYYYRRELVLEPDWRGKRLLLKFEGIFSKSFVYVNGSLVGSGDFGYASLTCDITSYVRFDTSNALLVVCKADLLSSRWYAGCGILRPVSLLVGEAVHVVPDTLWVHAESLAHAGGARIRVRASLACDGPAQVVEARLRMTGAEGIALDERFPVRVSTGGYELDRRLYLRDVRLWSEEDPQLYDVELSVGEDSCTVRTGIRTECWDPEFGLAINGRPREDFMTGDVNQFMGLMATRMADITRHPVVGRVLERLDACWDVAGYNYMTARYEADAESFPQRVMLGTETYPRQVAENWGLIERLPAVIGEFTWTGWDYVGELGGEPYPAWQNPAGDLDAFGFRRPVSYWREIVFGRRTQPYLAVRPPEAHDVPRQFGPWKFTDAEANWTWDVPAGTPVTVEVYAPDGPFELRLNGRVVAKGQTRDCYALAELPFEPGILEVAADSGACRLATADCATVCVARDDVEYDGWLVSRLWLKDAAGVPVPGAGEEVDVTRDGWQLVAAGSADTQTDGAFTSPVVRIVGQGALALYRRSVRG